MSYKGNRKEKKELRKRWFGQKVLAKSLKPGDTILLLPRRDSPGYPPWVGSWDDYAPLPCRLTLVTHAKEGDHKKRTTHFACVDEHGRTFSQTILSVEVMSLAVDDIVDE